MTDHEMVLLRAAVEACVERRLGLDMSCNNVGRWYLLASPLDLGGGGGDYDGTLADALTALLRDLGADVPEWPSEERLTVVAYEMGNAVAQGTFAQFARTTPLPEYLALRGGS